MGNKGIVFIFLFVVYDMLGIFDKTFWKVTLKFLINTLKLC